MSKLPSDAYTCRPREGTREHLEQHIRQATGHQFLWAQYRLGPEHRELEMDGFQIQRKKVSRKRKEDWLLEAAKRISMHEQ